MQRKGIKVRGAAGYDEHRYMQRKGIKVRGAAGLSKLLKSFQLY